VRGCNGGVQFREEVIHLSKDVCLVGAEDVVIGIWESYDMGRRYSGCECVSLRRTANAIIFCHRGFGVGAARSFIEVVRARGDGEYGDGNVSVLLFAEVNR
jgi:hypothetical protein